MIRKDSVGTKGLRSSYLQARLYWDDSEHHLHGAVPRELVVHLRTHIHTPRKYM